MSGHETGPAQDEPYYGSAAPLVPDSEDLGEVKAAAHACQACHLWRLGTQTVFGEGDVHAKLMLIGEQPGDREDQEGRPFVGPAGQLLTRAMEQAGIQREDVYITNAVKHFKWVPQGGRRLHQKPNVREQRACRPWLDAELARVKPEGILLLGATAAQSLLGSAFKLTQNRGNFVRSEMAKFVLATVHPSSILRVPDKQKREVAFASFVDDMKLIAMQLEAH